jgi:hypothetical protein
MENIRVTNLWLYLDQDARFRIRDTCSLTNDDLEDN